MAAPFTISVRVGFMHVDMAGIVFYPRYFELANAAVESFLIAKGLPFEHLHETLRLTLPTAELNTRFVKPSRIGDVLDFALSVEKLGRSSVKIALTATCAGETRIETRLTLVAVSLDDHRPRPLPDPLREAFAAHLTG
ncbi:MAG: thioesterase family protein [Oceanicaulis sp.]